MKDRDEHPASAQRLVTDNKGNYSVISKVWVTLSRQDILLEMTCEVTHRALAELLTSPGCSKVRGREAGWEHGFPGSTGFLSVLHKAPFHSWEIGILPHNV